jgi:hypothetical protein
LPTICPRSQPVPEDLDRLGSFLEAALALDTNLVSQVDEAIGMEERNQPAVGRVDLRQGRVWPDSEDFPRILGHYP